MARPATNWKAANLNALGSGGSVSDAPVFITSNYSVMMFQLDESEIRVLQNNPYLCVAQMGEGVRPIALGTEEQVRAFCVDLGKVWPLENRDNIGPTPNEQMIEVLQTQVRCLSDLLSQAEIDKAELRILIKDCNNS